MKWKNKDAYIFYLNFYDVHICIDCLHLIQVALPSFITLPHFLVVGITRCACSVLPIYLSNTRARGARAQAYGPSISIPC